MRAVFYSMIFLEKGNKFPPVSTANKEGLVAFSISLNISHLLEAYENGIFPWYNENEPVLWWSPNPRMVLFPSELKISKSMKKVLRDEVFSFTYNENFLKVIRACKEIYRPNQNGTWISDEIIKNYLELHKMGLVKSVEVWKNKKLVGGLYGVWINNVFCGESMFAKESNASKAGLIWFVNKFKSKLDLIDCQIYTDHLSSLGAKEIPRNKFISILKKTV